MAKLSLAYLLSLSLIVSYLLLHHQVPSCYGTTLPNEDAIINQTQSIDWDKLKFRFTKCRRNPSSQFCSNYAILLVNDFPHYGRMAANVVNLYYKLIRNGFRSTNIRVFYSNGSLPEKYNHAITVEKMQLYPATSIIKRPFLKLVKQICCCNIRSGFIYLSNPTSMKDKSIWLPLPSNMQSDPDRIQRIRLTQQSLGKSLLDCKAQDLNVIADQKLDIPNMAYREYFEQENTRFSNVSYIGSLYYDNNCRRGDITRRLINIDWRFCKPRVVKLMRNPMYKISHGCQPLIYQDWAKKAPKRTLFGSRCGRSRLLAGELIPARWC